MQGEPTVTDIEPGGTVPGKVHQAPGGVGRNIIQALAQLTRYPMHIHIYSIHLQS